MYLCLLGNTHVSKNEANDIKNNENVNSATSPKDKVTEMADLTEGMLKDKVWLL